MDTRNDIRRDIGALWRRLRAAWSTGRDIGARSATPVGALLPSPPDSARRLAGRGLRAGEDIAAQGGVLLQFPLRGEALLVKLAHLLRLRIAGRTNGRVADGNPLLLTLSPGPWLRLSIDRCAYVEFDAGRSAYHVAIEAAPDTTISLDTTDFDSVVNFVGQYVADRISAPATLEAAS